MADWIAAVVSGSLALLGAIGGQQLASRRDDKRWVRERDREDARYEREREREDLRFEREQQKFREQRDHDARTVWRAERVSAYADFFAAYEVWSNAVRHLASASLGELKTMAFDEEAFASQYSVCARAAEALELTGSSEVTEKVNAMLSKMFRATRLAVQAKRFAERGSEMNWRIKDDLTELAGLRDAAKSAARADVLSDPY
ncbi:hypothetical protein AB0F52_17780 [Amycolatopsis sp. NPDC024027]|uniref:hypothetical protein n=1 Tax=Amycolatopsis sp. NPDC024027 TaxID=3154327 RepID=UPI0033E10FAE